MSKLLLFFEAFLNMFRFIQRRRLRKETEEAARSARQLELVDLALRGVVDVVREQNKPLIAALEAQKASTEIVSQWLKGLQSPAVAEDTTPFVPSTPALNWAEDIAEEEGEPIPLEFRLALALREMENAEESTDFA